MIALARGESVRRRSTGPVLAVLSLCGTVTALQQTLIIPVLPDLPELLDTSPGNASWLVTATLLAGAVATPVVTRLADMFGKRLLMSACLVVMVAGSLLAALSHSLGPAVAGRAMQGVGLALIPVGIAVMRDELPPERVPLGVALMSATLAIGAGAGLPLSGVIAEHLDWHALFWVTAAAGGVMMVAVPLVLSQSPSRTRGRFDVRGALVVSTGLTGVLLALSKGAEWGWSSGATLGAGIGGAVLLLAFVPVQLRVANPLVDVRIARRPAVLLVNVTAVLLGFAMFANLLVTTQLLQLPTSTGYGLGLDVVGTGVWMAPSALVFGIMAPISAAVINRVGGQLTLLVGAASMGAAYVVRVYASAELWQVVGGSMLVSVGTSLTFAAMPILIMSAVPVTETASANGLNTLLRSFGTSLSSAAVAAVVTTGSTRIDGASLPTFGALSSVFWMAAGACLVATAVTAPLFRLAPRVGVRMTPGAALAAETDVGFSATALDPARAGEPDGSQDAAVLPDRPDGHLDDDHLLR
jgi:MFS family permease